MPGCRFRGRVGNAQDTPTLYHWVPSSEGREFELATHSMAMAGIRLSARSAMYRYDCYNEAYCRDHEEDGPGRD